VEYKDVIDRGILEAEAEPETLERQLFDAIQRASQIDLETARRIKPATDTDEATEVSLWDRLSLPACGLLLGFGAMIEIPLPGLLVGAVILAGTRPVYDRAFSALFKKGELAIDLLDGLAITLHTLEGNFFPPALMLGMVEGGEAIRDITARGSERASLDLLSCLGTEAIVEREGQELKIPIDQVVVGDRVIVYPGDQIPVDGTVLRGSGLVDQCKLTGESIPITRGAGEEVFASTILVDGYLCITAERIGADTRAGIIAHLMQAAPVYDTRVSNFATMVANQLVAPTLITSALVGTLSGDVSRAISILTLDVGTGIRISVPTTVLSALTYAARNGILIRTGRTIELLSEVDVIVFDKTGTLTQGQAGITGVKLLDSTLSEPELLALAATAEQGLTHPVAEAMIRHARNLQLPLGHCEQWEYHVGLGVEAQIAGQSVLVGSHRLMAQRQVDLCDLHYRYPNLESGCHSLVYVAIDGNLAGVILYSDPIRPESRSVVQALQAQGIEVYILSGDETRIANAIADELQIPRENVYAEAFPEQKVEVVKAIHDRGKTVAFCGDGINDSAALAYADVSISFAGASGIARETADVVLMEDDLNQLPYALQIAMQAMEIVNQNIAMVILPNVGAVIAGVFLAINPVLAIFINNGSAILAELNGLRPLLGPSGLPQEWLSPAPAPVATIDPVSSTLEVEAVRSDVEPSKQPALLPAPRPAVTASVPKPALSQRSLVPDELIQKDLARRFGVSPQSVSRRKRQKNFEHWSRTKDPDGVSWRYHSASKVFHPIRADPIPFRSSPASHHRSDEPEARWA
jgi:Cu2+-exporting ATPase